MMVHTVLKHRQVDFLDERIKRLNRTIADNDLGVASHDFLSIIDAQAMNVSWKSRRRHSQTGLRLLCLGLLRLLRGPGCCHASLGMGGKGHVRNHFEVDV